MSVPHWSSTRQNFSWILCILLLSILPSYGVLSQDEEFDEESLGTKEPDSGTLRLVNGAANSGRLEIFYEGEWGTICDDGWSNKEADVVCRSLGFANGMPIKTYNGSGKIFLAEVRCEGNEESILRCNNNKFEPHECTHKSDAGVSCVGVFNSLANTNTENYCTFDRSQCGYSNSASGSFRWVRRFGSTPSSSTGPSVDHTYGTMSGYYMYTEASSGYTGATASLVNSFSSRFVNSITFWYHMYGSSMGTLQVIIEPTKRIVWSLTGNQGNLWQYACIPVRSRIERIAFVGTRGSSYTGDMSIDDVIFSQDSCEVADTSTCTFKTGMCGYQTIQGNDSTINWALLTGYGAKAPIYDHSTNHSNGRYVAIRADYPKEGMRAYLVSQPLEVIGEMKLEFYYYMDGSLPGELQVSLKDKRAPLNSWSVHDWQDNGDHGRRWNYGCMNLHPDHNKHGNTTRRIVFTGITGTSQGISLALDDIQVSNGTCGRGIDDHLCTFDNPKLCDYKINCTAYQEYTWRRMSGSTPSLRTGPMTDASKMNDGYYLYAESSYGRVGDAVSIRFPARNTKGKYMKFNYHMYGQSMGSLHLRYSRGKSSYEEWQISGNQGNSWHSFCERVDENIDAVTLIAVRGFKYTSDIAVDNVFLDTKPCPNAVNCDFENTMCNYTMSYDYRYYRWQMTTGSDHTHGSSGHYLRVTSQSGMEGVSTTLETTVIKHKSNSSSLQFYYKASSRDSGKLMVQLNPESSFNMMDMMGKKSMRTDVEGWVMGCIDIPENQWVSANFTAISGAEPGNSIMLDDIYFNVNPCIVGIVNNVCTFDEPNECGYNVSCRGATQFLWKRGRKTNSSTTGPSSDLSNGNGYFMYTESSLGSPGDATHLEFPQFVTPPGHYLRFYYNMHGRDMGSLQVSTITPSGKTLKWSEKGDMGPRWMKGCVNLPANENTTVVFTGIRGNGPLGDIAIDDVAVVSGICHEQNMACNFSDEMVCGYKNVSSYRTEGWKREKSGSDVYMTVPRTSGVYGLKSPLRNLTDNCVQISYKITGERCELHVFTTYDDKKQLSLQSLMSNDTNWRKAQFYVGEGETHIIFVADVISSWYSSCSIKIEKIEISNGICPVLACPFNSTSCKDQTQCISDSLLCDRTGDCLDNSDEMYCPQNITCDFERTYLCGYNSSYGWYHTELINFGNPDLLLNNSAYSMSLNSGKSSFLSPKETISRSCLQFHYAGGTGSSLQVRAHYDDGRNSSEWEINISALTKWTIGQFELQAGTVYIEFAGSAKYLGLMIDNVVLNKGTCGKIDCSSDFVACASNEKCLTPESKCNRIRECDDASDERDCATSLTCDAEDLFQCGYQYEPKTWTVESGRINSYPDLDNSLGMYSGRYFASNLFSGNGSDHKLYAPQETLHMDACLSFYYSFHGSGEFEVLDNGKSQLMIRPNNINTWQKSQIQLMKGVTNITFIHAAGKSFNPDKNNILALDSIELTNGSCDYFECGDGWRKCPKSPICIPKFKFCDYEVDCPSGQDENNCQTYSDVRLVGGRNVQQGYVEIYYKGQWSRSCGSWKQREASIACRGLGFNGTAQTRFTTQRQDTTRGHIQSITCYGYEDSLSSCKIYAGSCSINKPCYCSSNVAVDCSDSHCESTDVPCASYNGTQNFNSTSSNNTCIPKESVCDGEKDCPGGTDEKSCSKCNSGEFQCLNYECIQKKNRCDGTNDCKDGSDEYHCFKHDQADLSFMMNGKYLPVCENNLKDQDIANKLCYYVGKGNASVANPKVSTQGVLFSYTADAKRSVLPGFKPTLANCSPLQLKCSRRECGRRSPNLYDPMIQHGHRAIPGKYPWQVSLHFDSRFICGGTLIDDRHVLTAAHCVRTSSSTYRYKVLVGSTLRYGGQSFSIKRIMAHKNFSMSLLRYDVAVLELDSPVQITDYIRPACLPSKMWTPYTQCFTTGWGRDEDNNQPIDLMETKVRLMSRTDCLQDYLKSDETTVCANHKQPNQPGCYGDSGGPLVCRNEQGYWEVIGVTSYGRVRCADPVSSPQVFADVYTLRKWISDHMTI